ncbi:hypothetical protein [Tardiphaga sp.]|uniref:hypothetical protein n=1 Tax=Tardiphaga sp. TaxID=1926292 RepID=UPI002610351E|nr:hypothetical protein [Tardiphaga sp.]
MQKSTRRAAILLLPLWLAACGGGPSGGISFTDDQGVANQPFPANYKTDLLAFLRAYLNDPVGVRDASMAQPVQRTVGGRLRYVSCVRYTAKDRDGKYLAPKELAVSYVDMRLDRVVEDTAEACAGASYAPFPEMEKMAR